MKEKEFWNLVEKEDLRIKCYLSLWNFPIREEILDASPYGHIISIYYSMQENCYVVEEGFYHEGPGRSIRMIRPLFYNSEDDAYNSVYKKLTDKLK